MDPGRARCGGQGHDSVGAVSLTACPSGGDAVEPEAVPVRMSAGRCCCHPDRAYRRHRRLAPNTAAPLHTRPVGPQRDRVRSGDSVAHGSLRRQRFWLAGRSRVRHSASLAVRRKLVRKPMWRRRSKPSGTVCSRCRRMNPPASSLVIPAGVDADSQKASTPFLKKRTKKLLIQMSRVLRKSPRQRSQKFFASFQKRRPCLLRNGQSTGRLI